MLRIFCVFLVSIIFFSGCSSAEQSHKLQVPSEFNYAKGILNYLEAERIGLEDISRSLESQEIFETKPNFAITINTNIGVFDLIYKNGEDFAILEKDFTKDKYTYEVQRIGGNVVGEYETSELTYFAKNEKFIAFTTVPELKDKIIEYYQFGEIDTGL